MTKTTHPLVGKTMLIESGTPYNSIDGRTKKINTRFVTVRKVERARNNRTRIFWKSNGYLVNALV